MTTDTTADESKLTHREWVAQTEFRLTSSEESRHFLVFSTYLLESNKKYVFSHIKDLVSFQ
jgi:hypothetical protein